MAVLVIIAKRIEGLHRTDQIESTAPVRTGIYLSQRLVEETSWSEVIAEGIDLV
jgi:hypothetical protein